MWPALVYTQFIVIDYIYTYYSDYILNQVIQFTTCIHCMNYSPLVEDTDYQCAN